MRQINEILRLKYQSQLSVREIARSCGLPTSTVGDYLKRAEAAQLPWPLPEDLTQEQLHSRLLGVASTPAAKESPDWPALRQELRRKGVTLHLLWQEYRRTHSEGYGYSRFCELYQRWANTLDPVLRQVHVPGEKLFVDWAGQTVPLHNCVDGSLTQAHLFVAVLGASKRCRSRPHPSPSIPLPIEGRGKSARRRREVPPRIPPVNILRWIRRLKTG